MAVNIAIVDYGMGNLRSVQKALERVGAHAEIVCEPEAVRRADKLVVPGVGAFADAISGLRSQGLLEPIREFIATGKPFLGICLGLQMLFSKSYEDGEHAGLDVVQGEVVRFSGPKVEGLKIPHMGWNQIKIVRRAPILEGIESGAYVYFVHSYYVEPFDRTLVATETEYGIRFTSMIWRDNLFATQFHPEKSQSVGLKMLENFVSL